MKTSALQVGLALHTTSDIFPECLCRSSARSFSRNNGPNVFQGMIVSTEPCFQSEGDGLGVGINMCTVVGPLDLMALQCFSNTWPFSSQHSSSLCIASGNGFGTCQTSQTAVDRRAATVPDWPAMENTPKDDYMDSTKNPGHILQRHRQYPKIRTRCSSPLTIPKQNRERSGCTTPAS